MPLCVMGISVFSQVCGFEFGVENVEIVICFNKKFKIIINHIWRGEPISMRRYIMTKHFDKFILATEAVLVSS